LLDLNFTRCCWESGTATADGDYFEVHQWRCEYSTSAAAPIKLPALKSCAAALFEMHQWREFLALRPHVCLFITFLAEVVFLFIF
jgi:hypothetical protein